MIVNTTLVLRTVDSFCVMQNSSAYAVSGFHSSTSIGSITSTIITMVRQMAARFFSAIAYATKLLMPGSAQV